MIVDRKWAERNTVRIPSRPHSAAAFSDARAARSTATPEDFEREIIDFDSEGTEGREFMPSRPRPECRGSPIFRAEWTSAGAG